MNDYQKRLEEFRSHYFVRYNLKLDDEVLFFFIRVHEMQFDLKKQITAIPKLTFKSGWDYFMYGIGRLTIPSIVVSIALIIILSISSKITSKDNSIVFKKGIPYFKINQDDSNYYLPLKTIPTL